MQGITYEIECDDLIPVDIFGPSAANLLQMPESVEVSFIHTESDLPKLEMLIGSKFLGVDIEWRPQLTKFEVTRPALL